MKRFLSCQPTPRWRTARDRGAEVANIAQTLPYTPMASSAALVRLALLRLLVVVWVLSALGTRSMAQEPAVAAAQIDSVNDWIALYAQSSEEQPPRPPQSDTQFHYQHDAVADTPAGLSSSSWSNSKTGKPRLTDDHELSVEPRTSQLLPSDAPAWVGSLPDLTGDVHRLFVGGHIAESAGEAAEGLDAPLVAAVNQYIDTHLLKRERAARALAGRITDDYVWKNLVDERAGYTARLNTPGQPMFQKWVTVSITPEQRAAILRWDREALQRQRLAPVGVG